MTGIEHRRNEARGQAEGGGRRQDPVHPGAGSDGLRSGTENRSLEASASRTSRAQGKAAKRDAPSWVNWQSTLYLFVLGWICVLLVPLTNLWWIALVCGTATPIALAMLDRSGLTPEGPEGRKKRERELLRALADRGELTPTSAAMSTSLTVDEASKMLEELARKGHLEPRVEDGIVAYTLHERDRPEASGEVPALMDANLGSYGAPRRLEDPLSVRELEVLGLLASGRTNSEIARDLFVSLGTVKSHTGNIYRKLGAKNRAEAVARFRELEPLS